MFQNLSSLAMLFWSSSKPRYLFFSLKLCVIEYRVRNRNLTLRSNAYSGYWQLRDQRFWTRVWAEWNRKTNNLELQMHADWLPEGNHMTRKKKRKKAWFYLCCGLQIRPVEEQLKQRVIGECYCFSRKRKSYKGSTSCSRLVKCLIRKREVVFSKRAKLGEYV